MPDLKCPIKAKIFVSEPHYFSTQEEFRAWLEANHKTATELIVGYHKVKSGIPSMTWSESVDQALCFGWNYGRTLTRLSVHYSGFACLINFGR